MLLLMIRISFLMVMMWLEKMETVTVAVSEFM